MKQFSTLAGAPHEVQLAVSIMPAVNALQSVLGTKNSEKKFHILNYLGAIYQCPQGADVYPPDPDEATLVSNENNFAAYSAFKALLFILNSYYTGGDPVLDATKTSLVNLIDGLESWFKTRLIPAKVQGENVISQVI